MNRSVKKLLLHNRYNRPIPVLLLAVILLYQGCKKHTSAWGAYKADAGTSSYADLKQINKDNIKNLQVAWQFSPKEASDQTHFRASQSNPIIIDGVMYTSLGKNNIYAINAANGNQLWSYHPFKGDLGGGASRGVTYWEDGDDKRILATAENRLYALDARTGKRIDGFGNKGEVDMRVGLRDNPKDVSVSATSPGAIYGDLIIMGATVSEYYDGQPGYVRAYNVKTGKLVWTFHTVPQPGEYGYTTWPKDAWKFVGGVNDWAGMSVDKARGMVFLALGGTSYDFYGGYRIGADLFANCVVALDARTGKHIWHFQTIHHDLWDYDLPAPPNLVTINKNGKKIDAVAQVTKTGFLFVLDRETGKSLFPIEERKVPASRTPGEQAWPTQPFPVLPKPYTRQNLTEQDLSDFSPRGHDSLVKLFRSIRHEGLFTPPDINGTLESPGTIGGADWGGGAYEPEKNIMYVRSNEVPEISQLQKIDNTPVNLPDFEKGKGIYMTYCAACHGKDKSGDEQFYPSLVNIQKRMSTEQVLNRIKNGGGKMPPFQTLIKGKEAAIIVYLFGNADNKKTTKYVAGQRAAATDTMLRYVNIHAYNALKDPQNNPPITPPWGTLNAINLSTGEYLFRVPLGNNPQLQKKGAPETGLQGVAGPIVTSGGLVFIAGSMDKKLKAYDKDTGKLLWETTLPGFSNATPCTYTDKDGKQYVAVSVAGDQKNPAGYVVAFSLKD